MRTALRRATVGVGTYVAAYLLMGLATVPVRSRILKATFPASGSGESVSALWHVYASAGRPVWKAVGWILLDAHLVVLRVAPEPNSITWKNPLVVAGVDWLYLVPAVACVGGGVAVVRVTSEPAPVALAVGTHLAVGYASAAVASAFAFRLAVGTASVAPALVNPVSLAWPIAAVGFPLVFGSLGAVVGRTPLPRDRLRRERG